MAAQEKKVPTLPRRQARSAQTRAGIVVAAERVFARSGLAGARIDAIAAEAQVNKALLYYYFKSKADLYQAVLEEHFNEFNRQSLEVLGSAGSPRAILLQYVSMHFEFISRHRRHASLYQQLMLSGGKPLERLVQRCFAPRTQALDKLLERGMRQGEFRRVDRVHAAVSIVALIVFYFSAARVVELLSGADAFSDTNLLRRKREVLDFVRHALFVHPEDLQA